jgi:hypothetical protein
MNRTFNGISPAQNIDTLLYFGTLDPAGADSLTITHLQGGGSIFGLASVVFVKRNP